MSIDMETSCTDIDNHNEISQRSIIDDDKKCYCEHSPFTTISVNCNLQVEVDPRNRVIYLCPRKLHFFAVKASKCCGDVVIKYKGSHSNREICGELATYKIVDSGIVAHAYHKLDYRKKDVLHFTAIDECTKQSYDFVVIFAYDPCECFCRSW